MKTVSFYGLVIFFTAAIVAVILGAAFYLTPLKHVNIVSPTVNDIAPTEFYEAFKENPDDYVFIDVRSRAAYERERAEGSRHIAIHNLYTEKDFLPKDKTIVLICTGGSASGVAYGYLEHHGFLDLLRIKDGVNAWKEAELPTVSSIN